MKTISVSPTFYRYLFPVLFAIPVLVFVAVALRGGPHDPPRPVAIVPVAVWLLIIFFWLRIWRPLADEVRDAGSMFIVKVNGREFSVPLHNIINISATTINSPSTIALRLREPSPVGRDIFFLIRQQRTMRNMLSNPFINELADRIDAARRQHDRGVPSVRAMDQ